jgi:hypothetical protein
MTAIPATPWQLRPDQIRELAEARESGKYIRRAVSVALFDGWTIAIFAAANFICGLIDVSGMFVGLALGVIAFFELRGASQLKRLDESAARRLGFNQIALGTILALYAVWHIYAGLNGPTGFEEVTRADPRIGKRWEEMARSLKVAEFATLILIAIFVQGGTALYYFTREKYIRAHRQRTPGWILQMQQAGVAV